MREFKNKEEALKWCMDNVKSSIIDSDKKSLPNYNRFRQTVKKYKKDPSSLKANAINNLFEFFGIKEVCSYQLDISKAHKDIDKDALA